MHKTDFNIMTCQSNNVGFNPLFFWAEFAAAKRAKISAIRTFKTESFNRGFYLSFIVMFDVNCFAHACISLADCRRWL
jgi:predicted membrane protein